MVVSILRQRNQTPAVKHTLNPTWEAKDATFDFPIYFSLIGALGVLELVLWDKDTFRKDYLGEVALHLEDWFKDGTSVSFEDPGNEVSVSCPGGHSGSTNVLFPSHFGPLLFPPSHPHYLLGYSRSNWDLFLQKMFSKLPTTIIFMPNF